MQIKQVGSLRRNAQAGFTLIELIVVIVILGILAATALPKFASLGSDARMAKVNAARGTVLSAAAMYHGKWLAAGSPSTSVTYDTNVVMNTTGYPTNAGIIAAAGGLADYDTTTVAGTIRADSVTTRTACGFTYTEATGVVSAALTSSSSCD
ncbi:MAG: type II secretion system protein [Pseudomonadota bacterium]